MKIDQKSKAPESVLISLTELGASLRGHRLLKRLTHEEVAQDCGFSRQTLSRIERGDPSVAIGQVARYADFLGVSKALQLKMPAKVDDNQRRVRHTARERSVRPVSSTASNSSSSV